MIQERYCSFEVAKLLKEKGFRDNCASAYMTDGDVKDLLENTIEWNNGLINWNSVSHDDLCYWGIAGWDVECSRPTHQMAIDWIREKHNILIWFPPVIPGSISKDDTVFYWEWKAKKKRYSYPHVSSHIKYETYEEAVEAALKYCLTELI